MQTKTFKSIEDALPLMQMVVIANCRRSNGEIEEHRIRRIKTKDTARGWQWSHHNIRTYFTLDVIEWREIN